MGKKLVFWLLIMSLMSIGTSGEPELNEQPPKEVVAIRALQNGKYVRAGIGKESYLGAVSKHVLDWEEFQVYRFSDGTVGLRSFQNAKYITVGEDKNALLEAQSYVVSMREKFKLIEIEGNSFAIMSMYNNKYVTVEISQQALLGATSNYIKYWEKFSFIPLNIKSKDVRDQNNGQLRSGTSSEDAEEKEDKYTQIKKDLIESQLRAKENTGKSDQ
ncbi:MAG: hypothetical protein Q8Q33_00645 [Chlamydiota bacterium]|nr:hypothetical protein [Chlamydiota bacterium]